MEVVDGYAKRGVRKQKESDLLFTNPKKELTPEQFADLAHRISENVKF